MSDSAAAFDSDHFRRVLGHFPTGVTINTGMAGDVPAGFTIGSFTSVSLDPPLVGFLPMVTSDTWAAMAPAGKFCVNVLGAHQGAACWRFAKKGVDDRFAAGQSALRRAIPRSPASKAAGARREGTHASER